MDEISRTELSSLIQVKFKEVLKNNNSLFDLVESSEATVNRDNSTSVSIGEIHLHEVNNVDSLANAIIRELPSKISQKLGQ